jgi:hypothetical protein
MMICNHLNVPEALTQTIYSRVNVEGYGKQYELDGGKLQGQIICHGYLTHPND